MFPILVPCCHGLDHVIMKVLGYKEYIAVQNTRTGGPYKAGPMISPLHRDRYLCCIGRASAAAVARWPMLMSCIVYALSLYCILQSSLTCIWAIYEVIGRFCRACKGGHRE